MAFIFGFIWGLCRGIWITLIEVPLLVVIVLSVFYPIPEAIIFLADIGIICLRSWFGIKGNSWVLNKNKYTKLEDFFTFQRRVNVLIALYIINVYHVVPITRFLLLQSKIYVPVVMLLWTAGLSFPFCLTLLSKKSKLYIVIFNAIMSFGFCLTLAQFVH